ncbi:MAG TPA: AprI/Inh family metalloprotease inhibitor [Devosia sp.]|jgi:hypothetical protein|nr:AprI/Inh family metalloprotease inhibitor [Devosia sp.]
MMVSMRGSLSAVGVAAIAVVLAACQSTGSNTANLNTIGAPAQLQAVPNSTVQQGTLPAIGATGTPAPGLSGQPVLGGVPATQTAMASAGVTAPGASPSIVSLSQPVAGSVGTGPEGAWNVSAGTATCRINLPMTAKTGTSYYRASAPGCTVPQIASVTGWQQVGSQLQLYDENGNIAAFLAPSGGRYIGTMGGGQAISMSR